MALTKPDEYNPNPRRSGLDERDADNSMYENKMPKLVKIVRPVTHRIVKDGLWIEVLTLMSFLITGIGQFVSNLTTFWYVLTSVLLIVFVIKRLNLYEPETETKQEKVEEVVEITDDKESKS